jgi:hypothetical protein
VSRIVVIAPELLLGTRVSETLTAAGHEVALASTIPEASLDGAELLVADLDHSEPAALVALGVPVLGFYPHTDAELRQRAEAAGVDLVVPRSKLVREMPELVDGLLAG